MIILNMKENFFLKTKMGTNQQVTNMSTCKTIHLRVMGDIQTNMSTCKTIHLRVMGNIDKYKNEGALFYVVTSLLTRPACRDYRGGNKRKQGEKTIIFGV